MNSMICINSKNLLHIRSQDLAHTYACSACYINNGKEFILLKEDQKHVQLAIQEMACIEMEQLNKHFSIYTILFRKGHFRSYFN